MSSEMPVQNEQTTDNHEFVISSDDPGFIAFQMHQSKLEMLLDTWIQCMDKTMSDSDEIVLDEIRHQIKTMMLDNTHDVYLKAVSVSSSIAVAKQ